MPRVDKNDFIVVTADPLKIDSAISSVSAGEAGATSIFIGTTRNNFDGKSVVRLEYEAYDPMARKEIRKVISNAREKWNLIHVAVHHRTGLVKVGEASIVIAVSSAHRKESLSAVQYLIDTIKATVPIWKKEVYEDGTSWKANKESAIPTKSAVDVVVDREGD